MNRIKTALFIDFDNVYLSLLNDYSESIARRFANPSRWMRTAYRWRNAAGAPPHTERLAVGAVYQWSSEQHMTAHADDGDVGSLRDRHARALRGDSTVRLAWLHGSRARGTARLESDIDVAVLLDDDHAASPTAIKDSIWCLAGALGREVRSDRIDLVLLNDAPALLRHRVIRDGILLFARTDAERVRFVLRTIREYQDMEPRLREHTRRWVERLRERRADGRYGDILESARRAGELLGPTVKTQ